MVDACNNRGNPIPADTHQGTSSRTGAVKNKQILGLPGGQSQNLKGRFRATRRKARFRRDLAPGRPHKIIIVFPGCPEENVIPIGERPEILMFGVGGEMQRRPPLVPRGRLPRTARTQGVE